MQHRVRFVVVSLALQLMAACAVLVDPESLLVRCELENGDQSRDPCLELGQQCVDNVCRDCDADAVELCNGVDDDCDGEIDEGHDADHDGFTWCGGGRVEEADCTDRDGAIHPGARNEDGTTGKAPDETCDGKDNDCDSKVDEDRNCDRMKTCVENGCPEGQRCDAETGVCIVPREVGSGCTMDSDCKGGFCLRPEMFGVSLSALKDNRCATACCSNADCDENSSCLISATGARVCLPKNIVAAGSRKVGERCVRDPDCMSRFCFRGSCQTPCFNSDGCPNQECVLSSSGSEPRTFLCGEPPGRTPYGEPCGLLNLCRNAYCDADQDFPSCGEPCGRDKDCVSGSFCGFKDIRQVLGPTSTKSVCQARAAGGGDAEGIEHLCCTDSDCGENQLCAPNQVSPRVAQWHMSCRGK
ncbi:MAG TPA: hypothetical protein VJR89_13955 [Polyangiales bacterium]|nr:hypothetical protein [Polyangiales bacterium]